MGLDTVVGPNKGMQKFPDFGWNKGIFPLFTQFPYFKNFLKSVLRKVKNYSKISVWQSKLFIFNQVKTVSLPNKKVFSSNDQEYRINESKSDCIRDICGPNKGYFGIPLFQKFSDLHLNKGKIPLFVFPYLDLPLYSVL